MATPAPTTTANAAPDQPKAAGYDPVALAESLASAAEKSAKLIGEFAAHQAQTGRTIVADELGIGKAFMEVAAKILANPYRMAESQMSLWQSSLFRMRGAPAEPIVVPLKSGKRFRHEDWEEHFLFEYVKQIYLI